MKKTNKIISILLAVAMLMTLIPMNISVSAAPDTDYNGYYKISNAGNLAWFACLVVGDTSQSGITEAVPDAKAVLTADIDITVLAERLKKSWVGIGTEEIPFTGVFDGNGYTIKGLTTDSSLTKSAVATIPVNTAKQGLFGVIGEGGIVRDVQVIGTANVGEGIEYGGICSENNGTIENVVSLITVADGVINADPFCYTNNGTITNSFTTYTTSVINGVSVVDDTALADGSVTYALGASFGQTIGVDTLPVHFDNNKVYKVGDTYTNAAPAYVASVTDKEETLVGNYISITDAVSAASANEGSTLTLLDDVSVTEEIYIEAGEFTLNLNDNKLFSESSVVIWICEDVILTIIGGGENSAIETTGAGYSAITNLGTLTIESGNFIADYIAVNNAGSLTINGGTFTGGDFSVYVTTGGSFTVNDGIFNGNVWSFVPYEICGGEYTSNYIGINSANGTLTISDGVFDVKYIQINRGTVLLEGGEFLSGLVIDDLNYDNDEIQYINDVLANGYVLYDKDGNRITVNGDVTEITGYVKVKEYVAASVTDEDGNELEDSPYKNIDDALAAAIANAGSTLALLDDITIEKELDIKGDFILDLNGKRLLSENGRVLYILENTELTIKDSGTDGIIESTAKEIMNIVFNCGNLTVDSGILKGDGCISNYGKLVINGGVFKAETYPALINFSSVDVYGGVFTSVKEGAIANGSDAIINIYDGEICGSFALDNSGKVYIYGGEFKGLQKAALCALKGTIEINGGTFTGADDDTGCYSGTPNGEYTVYHMEGADVVLKGGEFPNGFVTNDVAVESLLADYCYFYDEDDNKATATENSNVIEGYVQVKGAKLEDAVVTVTGAEIIYNGKEQTPEVVITVDGKTLTENTHYTVEYSDNINAGTAVVTITAVEDGICRGETTAEFEIKPLVVGIIWPEVNVFDYDGTAHSFIAVYVDVNGNKVDAVVENGTNTNSGVYTAIATIEDENYIPDDETSVAEYVIKGATIAGKVISFGNEADDISILLTKVDESEKTVQTVVTGNSAEFAFVNLNEGTYTITVSKTNHVTRNYEIVIGEEDVNSCNEITQDLKIHLLGDVNGDGKVNTIDVAQVNAHAKGTVKLEGYKLLCSDVNEDGKVNTIDVARINAHAKGITSIW